MVAEPWLLRMGNQVSSLVLNQTNNSNSNSMSSRSKTGKQSIGILSFEVSNVMSKLIHIHKSVSDDEITRLKNEIIKSEGVKKLVSSDESYLLELAFSERIHDLNRVAEVVSRLGNKCSQPALLGFQHVYADLTKGHIQIKDLRFLVKDMDAVIRKLERYVASTSNLYAQLEMLNDLERAADKFQLNQNQHSRRAFHQKLSWQRHHVSHLKDVSLWNHTYDKVVELLARTVCTLYARICLAFANLDLVFRLNYCSRTKTVQSIQQRSDTKPCNLSLPRGEIDLLQRHDLVYPCAPSPGRIFMECLSLSSSSSRVDYDADDFSCIMNGMKKEHAIYSECLHPSHIGLELSGDEEPLNASHFGPKNRLRLAAYATPSTVGGSALALHYANVIIIIEKLLRYPHLVGDEARDDLYQMLPYTLRKSLKMNLKSHFKNFAIFDGALAHDWKENLDRILKWLAPLAHNMIRWQSERNFEQQHIVTRTNVLLLQTLYFADRGKTEAAICDLLVGLNYICRYEHQQNALLDCASSFDFGDWMEWQLQCQGSCLDI